MDTSTRGWLDTFGGAEGYGHPGVPAAAPVEPAGPPGAHSGAPVTQPPVADLEDEEDLSIARAVLNPEDADLPILIALVGSPRWSRATPAGGSGGAHVAPRPLPLESLQSLPVASSLL